MHSDERPLDPASGAGMIALERFRQIDEEGYDERHDARIGGHGLARAAEAYLAAAGGYDREAAYRWPFDPDAFHPTGDTVRDLVKAGALIAASIDAHRAAAEPPEFDPVPDPGLEYEARFETADDGGEL